MQWTIAPPPQIPGVINYGPVREFLALDDLRSTLPVYDQKTVTDLVKDRMDLSGTERKLAKISDFELLKVIGKGSFGKVSCE